VRFPAFPFIKNYKKYIFPTRVNLSLMPKPQRLFKNHPTKDGSFLLHVSMAEVPKNHSTFSKKLFQETLHQD
jgi:hypothetical protein